MLVRKVILIELSSLGYFSSRLDWTDFEERDLPEVNVVVGSDLVYSPDLIPGLARVISSLLNKSRDPAAAAYIACTQRTRSRTAPPRLLSFLYFFF